MIATNEHKTYQKLMKKGKGSILRAIRTDKGGGKGLIAGGIVLLISVILAIPGLIMIVTGIILKHKRDSSWLSYYQEATGYSEGELQQIDKELASPSVKLVICKVPNAAVENYIACFITEHYMIMNTMNPYVRRLDEIIAAAFSDSTNIWFMSCLSKRDKETQQLDLFTDTGRKETLCKEILHEISLRNPNILCGQAIICEGMGYILERDGAEIRRLYEEGHTLKLA